MQVIKPIESRLEIASKVFSWNTSTTTPKQVSNYLGISVTEFYEMEDESFFDVLFSFYHNCYTVDKRI